jgi:hypothetical protein
MKNIELPFESAAAHAMIVRRRDGAILGVLRQLDHKFLTPGGEILPAEEPIQAITRILDEHHIQLIDPDVNWEQRLAVDLNRPRNQLIIYYLILVEDIRSGTSEALVDVRWLDQSQDVWSHQTREKMLLTIQEYTPDMLNVEVSVLESW